MRTVQRDKFLYDFSFSYPPPPSERVGTTFSKIFSDSIFIKKYQPNKPTFPSKPIFIVKYIVYGEF